MKSLFAPLAAVLILAGCASSTHSLRDETVRAAPNPPAPAYIPEAGRDAATIADMRAAPYVDSEPGEGRNRSTDASRLAAQGYVRIGTARYAATSEPRDEALRQARAVGADRLLLYAPVEAGGATNGRPEWIVDYYVRFRLPFGATFRDLRQDERATLGVAGGVQIGTVVGGTPASRANLLAGDFVVGFDGKPLADKAQFQSLLRAAAGRTVTLGLVRNGEPLQRVVKLGTSTPAR